MTRKQMTALLAGALLIIVVAAVVIIQNNSTTNDMSTMNMPDKSSQQSSNGASNSDAQATDKVTISNFSFNPATITVKVGTTVTWTNTDDVSHSVTADSGSAVSFDSGLFAKGKTYNFTFDKAGTYSYHCTPHPYMHGSVVVTN